MTREQLEHILRASRAITGATDIVVVGSQCLHAWLARPEGVLVASMEADVFTLRDPEDSDLIDGTIGEGSPFHTTFGYYAHGVGPDTSIASEGWKERLVPLRGPGTEGATGWCLEAHDLALAKLVAGREKDIRYLQALHRVRPLDPAVIRSRLACLPIDDRLRAETEARARRLLE